MTLQFNNAYLEKLFEGKPVPGKPRFSAEVTIKFKKTVLKLKLAETIRDIKSQRALNFEGLKGEFKGFYSVRVDYSYRLILTLDKSGTITIADVLTIHDLTNHYQ